MMSQSGLCLGQFGLSFIHFHNAGEGLSALLPFLSVSSLKSMQIESICKNVIISQHSDSLKIAIRIRHYAIKNARECNI